MNGLRVTGAEAILELGIYRCYVQLSCKREEGRDTEATDSVIKSVAKKFD